ncbi:glutathione S-transferase N-terminal domain-containing protein [Shewanella avicenniae]|uniref:Glutathione S-transferase N-terminal domain-containing protein n=1 Tax=Shewanella avicenniae TaxID=2814294 RepID=A0ABX7QQB5_9GAMM|nr:glutathione S-transferase N-terminal domain-containing protein [Shewanella avicenniae]QSX32900.1 glutathione S-transferase N-terminal domain-containing protein [Shewanella avicenniae]
MKLLYSVASPYARAVRVAWRYLHLTNIDEQLCDPFEDGAELLEANPLAKVPCLIIDGGAAIYDSEVILRYLATLSQGGTKLFFAANEWQAATQFSLLKGVMDAAFGLRMEIRRFEEHCGSQQWLMRHEQAILRALQHLDKSGITAEPFDVRHIMLKCIVDYLDFRCSELNWRNVAPAIALWQRPLSQVSLFAETSPC